MGKLFPLETESKGQTWQCTAWTEFQLSKISHFALQAKGFKTYIGMKQIWSISIWDVGRCEKHFKV